MEARAVVQSWRAGGGPADTESGRRARGGSRAAGVATAKRRYDHRYGLGAPHSHRAGYQRSRRTEAVHRAPALSNRSALASRKGPGFHRGLRVRTLRLVYSPTVIETTVVSFAGMEYTSRLT